MLNKRQSLSVCLNRGKMNISGFEPNRWSDMKFSEINNAPSEDDNIEIIPLIPGQAMGDLKLGMSREDLFKVLNKSYQAASIKQENFDEIGVKVQYKNDQVTLLESNGFWPLFLDEEFNIFASSFSDCIDWIKNKDPQAICDDTMIQSELLGIGVITNKTHDEPPYLVAIFPAKIQ